MLNRIFGAKTHTYLHILGLSGLAFALPLNKVMMSISMMFIVLNLLLEGDFKTYWNRIKTNRGFQLIFFFFLLHAISVIWSIDLDYAVHDLKAKLPIFIVPLALTSKPIHESKLLNFILFSFLGSIALTSIINFGAYNQWFGSFDFDDIRGMSLFSSHVRYGLLIVMAIAIIIHLFVEKQAPTILLVVLFIWLNFYTYYSQVLSGVITLFGIYTIALFYWLWQKWKILALVSLLSIVGTFVVIVMLIFKPITYNPNDYKNLPERTSEGHLYKHTLSIVSPETGKPIDIYICHKELKREWEKVSKIPYLGFDIKGQYIHRTLIRYMASMDVKKDAEGFAQLSDDDIRAIENGCATVHHNGVMARVYGLQFQLNNVSNPNGHSFLQRIEYWQTGIQIAKKHWLIGVGCGDVQLAFHNQYYLNNSKLEHENRDRSHNMYLTILLSLGILGLTLLLWSHFKYFAMNFKRGQIIAVLFMTIILISYMMEDTLETQTGVTFFALFYGLFSSFPKKEHLS